MAVITMEEYHEFPTLPVDSILHLKVDSTSVREVKGERNSWQKLEFKFKILGIQIVGDGSAAEEYEELLGQHIWGSVPYRFNTSPENKLRQWTEAIFGMELGVGFELDTEMFDGKQVRGITTTYEKRSINPRTGRPFVNHQVDSLLPFAGTVQGQASWTEPAAPVDPWGSAPAPAQPMATASAGPSENWALSDEPPF